MIPMLRVALSSAFMASSALAQDTTAPAVTAEPRATTRAPVPFGVGERAEYQVKFGFLSVGNGLM